MSPTSRITVATSIAPVQIPLQQSAVQTWLDLGFNVVSVNVAEEVAQLAAEFPAVRFVTAGRTGQALTGKPLVYFDDVLQALADSNTPVCGIVNADIHLRVDEDFASFLEAETRIAVVFGTRLDVLSLDDTTGTENAFGFDYYFFFRELIPHFPATDFCLGAPWWDTWAFLVPMLSNFELKLLVTDIAFHLAHASRWTQIYESFGARLLADLERLCRASGATGFPNLTAKVAPDSYAQHALLLVMYARARASRLYYKQKPDEAAHTSEDLILGLLQLQSLVRESKVESVALRRELDAVKRSISWRVTWLLRWLKAHLLGKEA